MDVTLYHWIFAALFGLCFIVGVVWAYRSDIRKNPSIFTGSWKFLVAVLLIIMLLIVVKILYRFS
jgi:hypothetical protein